MLLMFEILGLLMFVTLNQYKWPLKLHISYFDLFEDNILQNSSL